jgi:hypothetical protein
MTAVEQKGFTFQLQEPPVGWTHELFKKGIVPRTSLNFTDDSKVSFKLQLQRINHDHPYCLVGQVVLYKGDVESIRASSTILEQMMDQTFSGILYYDRSGKTLQYQGKASFHDFPKPCTLKEHDSFHSVLENLVTQLAASSSVTTCTISYG